MAAIAPPPASAVSAALTRGSIVQPTAIVTPGLTGTNAMSAAAVPPFGPLVMEPGSQIIVDPSHKHQEWLGVGTAITDAACYQMMTTMTPAAITAFLQEVFGTNGFSTVRICMGSSDYTTQTFQSYCDNGGTADPNLTTFSVSMDEARVIPMLQQILAINPRIRVIAAPWTPPIWLKTVVNVIGGYFNATSANLTTYANYFVKFLQAYAAHGINVSVLTMQNEPNFTPSNYPGCQWNPADMASFAPVLRAALDAAGFFPEIYAGDAAWGDTGTLATAVLAGTTSGPAINGAAYHAYDGNPIKMLQDTRPYPGKSMHMTEMCYDIATSTTTVATWAGILAITSVRYGISSLTAWNLALSSTGAPWIQGATTASQARGLVTISSSGVITRDIFYYVLAHLGKYVKPGAFVCRSNTLSIGIAMADVGSVAFVNPDGSVVAFLWNANSAARTVVITDAVTGESIPVTLNSNDVETITWAPGTTVAAGTYVAPTAPQSLTATATAGSGNVTYAWQAPASKGSSDLGGYVLMRATTAGGEAVGTPLAVIPPTAVSYVDTAITIGTTYYAKIMAFGAGGYSPASSEVSATPTAAAPPKPTLTVTPGSGQNTITISVSSNNASAMVSYQLNASATSGSEASLTTINSTALSVTYAHTGLTNGTAEYYTATATNGVGTSAISAEASGTPVAGSTAPTHYLSTAGTSGGTTAPASTAHNITTGLLDARAWVNLSSYVSSQYLNVVTGNYPTSGAGTTTCAWNLGISQNGSIIVQKYGSTGTYGALFSGGTASSTSATIASASPSSTTGIWLRAVLNATTAAITDQTGVSRPAGSVNFYTSPDGTTWTLLGAANQGAGTDGFEQLASGNSGNMMVAPATGGVGIAGKVYKVLTYDGASRITHNPDFTGLATGTTTFNDTASTVNAWTVVSSESVA